MAVHPLPSLSPPPRKKKKEQVLGPTYSILSGPPTICFNPSITGLEISQTWQDHPRLYLQLFAAPLNGLRSEVRVARCFFSGRKVAWYCLVWHRIGSCVTLPGEIPVVGTRPCRNLFIRAKSTLVLSASYPIEGERASDN